MTSTHPRFPSVAQAVRAGIRLVPDPAPLRRYLGVSAETVRLGCDALVAAWFAEFFERDWREGGDPVRWVFLSAPLLEAYPILAKNMGPGCPLGTPVCPQPNGA